MPPSPTISVNTITYTLFMNTAMQSPKILTFPRTSNLSRTRTAAMPQTWISMTTSMSNLSRRKTAMPHLMVSIHPHSSQFPLLLILLILTGQDVRGNLLFVSSVCHPVTIPIPATAPTMAANIGWPDFRGPTMPTLHHDLEVETSQISLTVFRHFFDSWNRVSSNNSQMLHFERVQWTRQLTPSTWPRAWQPIFGMVLKELVWGEGALCASFQIHLLLRPTPL